MTKSAIVTGGSRCLGRSMVLRLGKIGESETVASSILYLTENDYTTAHT